VPDDKRVVCVWCGREIPIEDSLFSKRRHRRRLIKTIYYCKDFKTCHEITLGEADE